jgi:hypothetical protein
MNFSDKSKLKFAIKQIIKEELSKDGNVDEAYKGGRWYGEEPENVPTAKSFKHHLAAAALGLSAGLYSGVKGETPSSGQVSSTSTSSVGEQRLDFKSRLFSAAGIKTEKDLNNLNIRSFIRAIEKMIKEIKEMSNSLSPEDKQYINDLIKRFISDRVDLQSTQRTDLQRSLESQTEL